MHAYRIVEVEYDVIPTFSVGSIPKTATCLKRTFVGSSLNLPPWSWWRKSSWRADIRISPLDILVKRHPPVARYCLLLDNRFFLGGVVNACTEIHSPFFCHGHSSPCPASPLRAYLEDHLGTDSLRRLLGGTVVLQVISARHLDILDSPKSSVSCDSIIQVSPKFPPIPSPKDLGAALPVTLASDPGTGRMSGNFCGLQQTCGQFSNSTRGGSV